MSRLHDLVRFYQLLSRLDRRLGGTHLLGDLSNSRNLPRRGVYFFFEPGEFRRDSGEGPRVVRVGTHALTSGSRSTLRQRLGQHRGNVSGGGNHRGSIFRLLVGQALLARNDLGPCQSWGVKGDAAKASVMLGKSRDELASDETPVEITVSRYLGAMPFLWLAIEDEPGPDSLRGGIERGAIALLSNYRRAPLDVPSSHWLGLSSGRALVRESGLWNQRHVEEVHDPAFLNILEKQIERGASV